MVAVLAHVSVLPMQPNSALMPDAYSLLRRAYGAAKRER
jgi:hypothetical protein